MSKTKITISTKINADIEKIWQYWRESAHICQWNNASPDWHTPKASNDLRKDGLFNFTMAAKDGSFQFDFSGKYCEVKTREYIKYAINDGRIVENFFEIQENCVQITTIFEAEETHTLDMQQAGWQSILDNFKKYCELN